MKKLQINLSEHEYWWKTKKLKEEISGSFNMDLYINYLRKKQILYHASENQSSAVIFLDKIH